MGQQLAGRPPLASVIGLVFRAAVITGCAWLPIHWLRLPHKHVYSPSSDGFWLGVGITALLGLLALWCLLGLVRGVRRWTSGAGVWIDGDQLHVRAPGVVSSWNPGLGMQVHRVPLADVRAIDFRWGENVRMILELGDVKVEIPSGAFAVGAYDLDAAIRAHATHLEAAPALEDWTASAWVRLLMIPLGLACWVLGTVVLVWAVNNHTDVPKIFMAPYFLGIAFFILPFVYRGKVVIDRRGVFHQASGKIAFVPWHLVRESRIVLASQLPGWSTMHIRHGRNTWLHLTRLFGLGFPTRWIATKLEQGPS